MKTRVPVFLCACTGIALLRTASLAQDRFVPLLDDEHKGGWQHRGSGGVKFEDGVLTTQGKKQGDGFYCYMTQVFTDFVLRLEFKNLEHASNSGVFLRMLDTKDEKSGYEVQIDGDTGIKYPTGAIWGFQPPSSVPQRPVGEWNEMQIMVEGQKYRVALNGKVINEFTGNRHETGYIGLQNHHDGPVQIRNVSIRELHTTPPLAASHAPGSRPPAVPAPISRCPVHRTAFQMRIRSSPPFLTRPRRL